MNLNSKPEPGLPINLETGFIHFDEAPHGGPERVPKRIKLRGQGIILVEK